MKWILNNREFIMELEYKYINTSATLVIFKMVAFLGKKFSNLSVMVDWMNLVDALLWRIVIKLGIQKIM